MRTTLTIDDDVLSAVGELAKTERKTVGQILSDLARTALKTPTLTLDPAGRHGLILRNGFYLLPRREGVIVTNELIDRLTEEADLEDAGLSTDK